MKERYFSRNQPKSFEELFKEVSEIKYEGATVEYVDLNPERYWDDYLPIVLVGGWATTLENLRDFAEEIHLVGRRVIVLDYTKSAISDKTARFESGMNREVSRKAEGLIEVVGRIGLERSDIIAISEGALVASMAAKFIPGYFRNLALLTPAGMIGRDGPWRPGGLAWRYFVLNAFENRRIRKESMAEILPEYDMDTSHTTKDWRKYYKEGREIAHSRIDDLLKDLRQDNIGIGILQAHKDVIFPNERMKEQIRIEGQEANADSWSVIAAKQAGHHYALTHPNEIAVAALHILDDLQAGEQNPCRDGNTKWGADRCRQRSCILG